jgi:Synaptobrevin
MHVSKNLQALGQKLCQMQEEKPSNENHLYKRKSQLILWASISRDSVILAEAGEDELGGQVIQTAKGLLAQKDTAGYEFYNCRNFRCRGIKLHVFDKDPLTDNILVWKFAAVYHKELIDQNQVESFLHNLVMITQGHRDNDDDWRCSKVLAAQVTFAPTLLQCMEDVDYLQRLATLHKDIDGVKEIMAKNIEMALSRGEKLEEIEEKASTLQGMANQFKKNTLKLKRFHQWQNAKYGIAVGTAVAAVVAVVTIPPLIVLL